jgi:helix-turn-helix protein
VSAAQAPGAVQAALFFTPAEVAALLRRSVKSLYRMIEADATFPVTRLPSGGLLIPRQALEQWLRDRTQGMRTPLRLAAPAPTSEATATHAPAVALNGTAKP